MLLKNCVAQSFELFTSQLPYNNKRHTYIINIHLNMYTRTNCDWPGDKK